MRKHQWLGKAGHGVAWQGGARPGRAGLGKGFTAASIFGEGAVRCESISGMARLGTARLGQARHGRARQGRARASQRPASSVRVLSDAKASVARQGRAGYGGARLGQARHGKGLTAKQEI